MDLGVLLESPQGSQCLSRVGPCTCAFLPSCGSSVGFPFAWIKGSVAFHRGFPRRLSHDAFPRRFPIGLSHVPPWCESILGLKFEALQGKQVSLEWTVTSGGLWEWWHDPEFLSPFLWRAPPLEMRRECREFFLNTRERIPPLELGVGNGAPLDVSGTLVLPLEWRRVCRGTS